MVIYNIFGIITYFHTAMYMSPDLEKDGLQNEPNYHEGFSRKVYGITGAMLALTTLFTIIFYDTEGRLAQNTTLLCISFVASIAIIIALTCCGLSVKVPINYILVFLFTIF